MVKTATRTPPSIFVPVVLGLLLAGSGCGRRPADSARSRQPILVFAAASLENAMREAAAAFTERNGVEVSLNAAGSNVLAQQIEAGAPADLFVSADARWIDDLVAHGSLDAASRRELLTNRLVVIAPAGSGWRLGDLAAIGALPFRHLSIADPDSVPAGRYARSVLQATSTPKGAAWDQVAARVAPAPDVRAALAMVAAEPETIGIVYRTDVAGTAPPRGVQVLLEIEREPDPPIRYVAALVKRSPGVAPGSTELLGFLAGEEARSIFARYGFLPLPAATAPSSAPEDQRAGVVATTP